MDTCLTINLRNEPFELRSRGVRRRSVRHGGGSCKMAVEGLREETIVHTVRKTKNYSGLESLDKVF